MSRDINQVTYLEADELKDNASKLNTADLAKHVDTIATKARGIARVLNMACVEANDINAVDIEGAVWALDDYLQDLSFSSSELGMRAKDNKQYPSEVA
ncbi:hypothetical protein [Alteromonas antoniana]|uniref:hypothetical protein n=1 Tax=Alteromonas antoniana TaxID=2803813 RepID=UPI001C45702F|nr:hypothetical protein [Alteromonas antoniana]